MREDLKQQGYSKEDEYFYKKDRELLEKLREKAEAQKQAITEQTHRTDLQCPRCGAAMREENYSDLVIVDRCSSAECGGMFFDGGELEILLKAKSSLFERIFKR